MRDPRNCVKSSGQTLLSLQRWGFVYYLFLKLGCCSLWSWSARHTASPYIVSFDLLRIVFLNTRRTDASELVNIAQDLLLLHGGEDTVSYSLHVFFK